MPTYHVEMLEGRTLEQKRKLVEESLAASQERLEIAQSAAGVGFWGVDLDTGKTWWSTEAEKLYGLPPNSFDGTQDAWLACSFRRCR